MSEQKTELYQAESKIYCHGGLSFGGYLKESRLYFKRTEEQVADLLGISLEFYRDLENDKRYPPVGDLYKKISKVCDIVEITGVDPDGGDDADVLYASDFAGLKRDEITPDTIEFLSRNWFARYIVNLMEQADADGQAFLNEEDLCSTIRDSIHKIAEKKGIKIQLPEIDDEDDE